MRAAASEEKGDVSPEKVGALTSVSGYFGCVKNLKANLVNIQLTVTPTTTVLVYGIKRLVWRLKLKNLELILTSCFLHKKNIIINQEKSD